MRTYFIAGYLEAKGKTFPFSRLVEQDESVHVREVLEDTIALVKEHSSESEVNVNITTFNRV